MLLNAFTLFHVAISLVGIGAGLVVLYGMLNAERFDRWTAVFLATTVATSVTGYFFPFHHVMPSHIVGALSLVALAIAIYARYSKHLAAGWRNAYVIAAAIALYFNVFVLIAQSFQKIAPLKALAPTQTEPPFLVTQLVVMVLFVVLTVRAVAKFHLNSLRASAAAGAR